MRYNGGCMVYDCVICYLSTIYLEVVVKRLLFSSYKFVKGFLAITFLYYLLFLAETCMMCVNVFCVTRNEIQVGSDN